MRGGGKGAKKLLVVEGGTAASHALPQFMPLRGWGWEEGWTSLPGYLKECVNVMQSKLNINSSSMLGQYFLHVICFTFKYSNIFHTKIHSIHFVYYTSVSCTFFYVFYFFINISATYNVIVMKNIFLIYIKIILGINYKL